jgi:hypothetical protein
VICGRRRDEQDCSWTFKLGIVPVAIYDREQADTKGLDQFGAKLPDLAHKQTECRHDAAND